MQSQVESSPHSPQWSAVLSLFMGVTSLISAEFIPVSLLTPMAHDLGITEGMAGQTVTAVGVFAVLSSLLIAPLTRNINRRLVLLSFSVLLILSNVLVAVAASYPVLLIGRGLLGISVGGFWSMASAVTLQLVPDKDVPKALSIVYAGVSVATIISLPLASWLGHLLGWRNIFLLAACLSCVALIWQWRALPSLPAGEGSSFRNMFALCREKWVVTGIAATVMSYGGYHVFFTYLRPFLEHDLELLPDTLAFILLLFGVANCAGTFVAGAVLGKYFRPTMYAIPLALVVTAVCLFVNNLSAGGTSGTEGLGGAAPAVAWGFIFGFIPVGWSTWIARTLADRAELAGGLSVAAIQFAIGLAAAVGGVTFDTLGIGGIFVIAAVLLLLAFVLTRISFFQYAAAMRVLGSARRV